MDLFVGRHRGPLSSSRFSSRPFFNALRSVLCAEQLAVGQLITLNKSGIIRKSSLVTVTPSIRTDQVMNGTYNAGITEYEVDDDEGIAHYFGRSIS